MILAVPNPERRLTKLFVKMRLKCEVFTLQLQSWLVQKKATKSVRILWRMLQPQTNCVRGWAGIPSTTVSVHRSGVIFPSLNDDGAKHVTQINGNGVILGCGAGANCHSGNIHFHNIAKDFQSTYTDTAKHKNIVIAAIIFDLIHQSAPSRRFLIEDPVEKGVLSDVGGERAT
jgi:hypothetical protein